MANQVLVIEDDVEINELLGEYLALEKIPYLAAFDGHTGIDSATQQLPRAIILDLMLPDIDGYHVCRALATRRATAAIPITILTCMNQCVDREKAFASGAIRFMNKPFLPDDLIKNVADSFAWHDALATRPPQGIIPIASGKPEPALKALREMTADLFTRSDLTDEKVTAIWDGFLLLIDSINRWAADNKRSASLAIAYRITFPRSNSPTPPADSIEWTLTETIPGFLGTLPPLPPPAPPHHQITHPAHHPAKQSMDRLPQRPGNHAIR